MADDAPPLVCEICKQPKAKYEVIPLDFVRGPLAALIKQQYPDAQTSGYICLADLNRLRAGYVQDVLRVEHGELTELEQEVADSLHKHEILTENIDAQFERQLTFGERVADKVAEFGGSWAFILSFGAVLVCWIVTNIALLRRPFDPFPFILLNLVLSCIAAIQAPVIMMSQNRQEDRDRLRAENDYRTNLKAELEIRHLHEKIDYLILHQWQRLLEIQQMQLDLMEELTERQTWAEESRAGAA
jgi:uncharacterized membrane protein